MRGGSFQPAAFPPMYRKAERYGRAKKMRAGKTGTAGGNFSAGTDVLRDEREGRDLLMKSIRILAVMILALLLAAPAAGASAGEVRPIPVDHDRVDLGNGRFCLTVRNADRITGGGYLIAVLYREDCYDGEQIKALAPGDTVYVNDRQWNVEEIVIHGDPSDPEGPVTYEIYTAEETDGYLVFQPRGDNTFIAVMNDWVPVVLLGSVKIPFPPADDFEYIRISAGEAQDPLGAPEWAEDLEMFGEDTFNAYNTTCEFRDGQLIRVIHSSYPQGPDESADADPQPVPVWKFCHGLRDGLDTAVITGWTTDCEEGSIPIEMTPEETEEIRRLAMNGTVTGKAGDESVTGGTWVYTFETPGGKHLLTIELYRGMIVAPDGMYRTK